MNRFVAIGFWVVAALLPLSGGKPALGVTQLGDLTGSWQLFVDDYLIARKQNVGRTYHEFQKRPAPVMVADKPWESTNVYLYGTVLPAESGSGYRMWYHCYDYTAGKYRMLYATSTDGINWVKPNLGIVDYAGSTQNNIFLDRQGEEHSPQVIHTPWETDPQRRYKMINFDYGRTPPVHTISGYWGSCSSDGIHWTWAPEPGNPVLRDPGDVGNFVWDPSTQRYVGYPKKFAMVRGFYRRCVGFSATTVFETWPLSRLSLVPDEYDDRWVTVSGQRTEFYGLSGFAYESMYIGFLWVFRITDGDNDGPIFDELASSHDGLNWTRQEAPRSPCLPLGAAGSWDSGMIFTPNHPLVEGDTIKLYYSGWNVTHNAGVGSGAIGLATLRKDGFASLDAGAGQGVVTTKKLRGAHGQLRVNFAPTTGSGSLRAEVLDQNGQVVRGYSRLDCNAVQSDGVNQIVTWGPLTSLPSVSDPIRLQFVLQNGSLYSFQAGDGVRVDDAEGVLYTLENDTGTTISDKLIADGAQGAVCRGAVAVDSNPAHAAFGTSSLAFTGSGSTTDTVEIEQTFDLGRHFTLAAMVNDLDNRFTRLFSNYRGTGTATANELIFDFDPSASVIPGLRFIGNGGTVQSNSVTFADNNYHHLAMTYDDGAVKLYLDGAAVGQGTVPAGPVWLDKNLRVGEDAADNRSLSQTFDTDPVGSAAGWEGMSRWFNGPAGTIAVTGTDARSAPHSLSWTGDGDSCQLLRPWGFASDGVNPVTVSLDVKIVNRGSWIGITPFGYSALWGGTFNGQHGWPVVICMSPTDNSDVTVGFSYYEDPTGWANFLSIPTDRIVGNWFHITTTLYPATQTADVTVTQITGPGAGASGTLTGRHFQYGYVTDPGWYTPALDDLRGSQLYAWDFQATESVLIDNFSVQNGSTGGSEQLRGFADDILVLKRAMSADEIMSLRQVGAARLLDKRAWADLDGDGDVDLGDFSFFQACFGGPNRPITQAECGPVDFDGDGDVDLTDFGTFQTCFNGPNRSPACGQ